MGAGVLLLVLYSLQTLYVPFHLATETHLGSVERAVPFLAKAAEADCGEGDHDSPHDPHPTLEHRFHFLPSQGRVFVPLAHVVPAPVPPLTEELPGAWILVPLDTEPPPSPPPPLPPARAPPLA